MSATPLVALYRSKSLLSKAIQWQTDSKYSHAAVYFPFSGKVIEAWHVGGVRKVGWVRSDDIDLFHVKGPVNWGLVNEFLHQQIGKPYDYLAIARFISRFRGESNTRWFCSELVFEAIQYGGVSLLDRIEPYQVSPGKHALSPLLKPVT